MITQVTLQKQSSYILLTFHRTIFSSVCTPDTRSKQEKARTREWSAVSSVLFSPGSSPLSRLDRRIMKDRSVEILKRIMPGPFTQIHTWESLRESEISLPMNWPESFCDYCMAEWIVTEGKERVRKYWSFSLWVVGGNFQWWLFSISSAVGLSKNCTGKVLLLKCKMRIVLPSSWSWPLTDTLLFSKVDRNGSWKVISFARRDRLGLEIKVEFWQRSIESFHNQIA